MVRDGTSFDWLSRGDVPLDVSGLLSVSQSSYDYTRQYRDQLGATIAGTLCLRPDGRLGLGYGIWQTVLWFCRIAASAGRSRGSHR